MSSNTQLSPWHWVPLTAGAQLISRSEEQRSKWTASTQHGFPIHTSHRLTLPVVIAQSDRHAHTRTREHTHTHTHLNQSALRLQVSTEGTFSCFLIPSMLCLESGSLTGSGGVRKGLSRVTHCGVIEVVEIKLWVAGVCSVSCFGSLSHKLGSLCVQQEDWMFHVQ